MSLLETLSADFSEEAREQGRGYFDRGAVQIRKTTPGIIRSIVAGSRSYAVRIERDASGRIDYECSCGPHQDNGLPCKHLWAAILKAQAMGVVYDLVPEEDRAAAVAAAQNAKRVGGNDDDSADDSGSAVKTQRTPAWKQHLIRTRKAMRDRMLDEPSASPALTADRQIVYVVDRPSNIHDTDALVVELGVQEMRRDDVFQPIKPLRLTTHRVPNLLDPRDRELLQRLAGAERADVGYQRAGQNEVPRRYVLPASIYAPMLKLMCETGRCYLRRDREEVAPILLTWDDGEPWTVHVDLRPTDEPEVYQLEATLRRGYSSIPATDIDLALAGGLVMAGGNVAKLEHGGAFDLLALFRDQGTITVPAAHLPELVRDLYDLPRLPTLGLPEEIRVEEVHVAPVPKLAVRLPDTDDAADDDRLVAELGFDYEDQTIAANAERNALLLADQRRAIVRDRAAEATASARLLQLGFRADEENGEAGGIYRIAQPKLPRAILALVADGWRVEADGNLYRTPGEIRFEVRSGIDWFDLSGRVDFGTFSVTLPRLLEALRKGETTVQLEDGSYGIVPEEWLGRFGMLTGIGQEIDGQLRFSKQQIGFLDALLATTPEANFDETFLAARKQLANFSKIEPGEAPATFVGELRPYQRDGLGWMEFLRVFGFGGCLADDMGLGKTVQVLAMLEARRVNADARVTKPSLVVVPRSLVFNWKQESEKFSPRLKLLDHSGGARAKTSERFEDYDVILTTYGTLRLDVIHLKDYAFDYVILDEAQAIKNASTEAAKTVRLLKADHRLALSGTPIENHIGELWSLFEFLNPGMLGRSSMLNLMSGSAATKDVETRQMLAKALRPFILRRTKEQVASDLPEKLEQTIACELEPDQRKLYDELRNHYRTSLLDRVAKEGINAARMQILEALLRLRQAACHPGLIDAEQRGAPSAKLDELIPRLAEAVDEGHKVLVFSQFTSFLAIVQDKLKEQNLTYEYLDGKTRDRQERVERFQNDPDCKLFLISLRAGGLGLNLTAADYVFLLDPWWNPAVEAQAIDRAHRIGQTRNVFAYRLIAKDTVEEKVLELQNSKRDLADAIINADNSLLGSLGREELELLLS